MVEEISPKNKSEQTPEELAQEIKLKERHIFDLVGQIGDAVELNIQKLAQIVKDNPDDLRSTKSLQMMRKAADALDGKLTYSERKDEFDAQFLAVAGTAFIAFITALGYASGEWSAASAAGMTLATPAGVMAISKFAKILKFLDMNSALKKQIEQYKSGEGQDPDSLMARNA